VLPISAVEPGSIADQLDLEPGDLLLTINGLSVNDVIDFQVLAADEDLLLEIEKTDGELWDLEVEKEAFQPLGLEFPPLEPMQCGNNCIFCFVHQLPSRMRTSLYVKDEDYRFSFLYGSYVTLSNISEPDLRRILDQRLSPLYVSVHATDDQLRNRLLGREVPPLLDLLRRLTFGGIQIHAQIVVCPGINDGPQLDRTIEDLFQLHPGVASLAIVPVGLTGYRERLPDLRAFTAAEAEALLWELERYQDRFLRQAGTRFLFAADEFYLLASRDLPPIESYEDLPQLENGVGMIAQFREEAERVLASARPMKVPPVSAVTGVSGARELIQFAQELGRATSAEIRIYPLENRFFGGHVSVTGLLTGRDLLDQLPGRDLGSALFVPEVMLKEGEAIFLDDLTLEEVGRQLGVPTIQVPNTPAGLLAALEGLRVHTGFADD